jgi:hypothetical protein
VGVTASVMCRCYQDGLTTPCPFPEHFVANPEEMPGLEWAQTPTEEEAAAVYDAIQAWLQTCCPHPNLIYAEEFIASWDGMNAFSDALEEIGAERFPHLTAHLPYGDDGITTPEVARLMLAELDDFARAQLSLTHPVLVDEEQDSVISMGSHRMRKPLIVDRQTGLEIGFNARGFFVRDRLEMNRLLFQSMHLEQQLLSHEPFKVKYVDLASQRSFVCSLPFGPITMGDDGLPRPAFLRMRVELRPSAPNRFAYLTDPLRRVLQAAVDIGHPVRWY